MALLKGQLKTKEITTQDRITLTNKFLSDDYHIFLYKKAERLSSGTYLLTSLFKDSEPVKWTLREISLGIISEIVSLAESSEQARSEIFKRTAGMILHQISILEVALHSGLMSDMNFAIITRELENFFQSIDGNLAHRVSGGVALTKSFFALDSRYFFRESKTANKRIAKRSRKAEETPIAEEVITGKRSDAENQENIGHQHIDGVSIKVIDKGRLLKKSPDRKGHLSGLNMRDDRREMILSALKHVPELGVKDFSVVMKNCSEKTIQRELVSMVSEGVLNKSGAKRWTRYFLPHNNLSTVS
jgi:hypothetical protein